MKEDAMDQAHYTILKRSGPFPDSRIDLRIDTVRGLETARTWAAVLEGELSEADRREGVGYYVLPYPVSD